MSQDPPAAPPIGSDGEETRDSSESPTQTRAPIEAPELPTVPTSYYALGSEVARGGMGRIVAARDRRLGREVAIKELLPGSDELRSRFEREALTTARLQHPAIINVYEAGRWPGGEPFFAMKLVAGTSLGHIIRETSSAEERLALLPSLITVVEALAYAHGEGVIHRDLKPANVLVGPFGEAVVIDWGLAKDRRHASESQAERAASPGSDELTADGAVMGTPAFMPPEQARGLPVDERADVYALGAMLYHLLVGKPPYAARTWDQTLRQVLEGPPEPLDAQAFAPDLIAIVAKAMARDPGLRYPSARELARDLQRFRTGQLVGAHRYTSGQLLSRWLHKHRAVVATAAAAALALLALGVFSVERIARERNQAQAARQVAEARNDELILNQARMALGSDPTAAVAWLKHYSAAGPAWSAARTIAAQAHSAGIARKVLRGHEHAVNRVAFSPDGKTLASASADRTLRLWDLATGSHRVLSGHDWFVSSLAFSPDGQWLASAGGRMLFLWNVATGQRRVVHGGFMDKDVAFSPDGEALATLGFDEEGAFVHLWNPSTDAIRRLRGPAVNSGRTQAARALGGHSGVRFSPDGGTVAALTAAGTLRLWDVATGRSRTLPVHGAFAFAPDGLWLVGGGPDHGSSIWDLQAGRERAIGGHARPVSDLAISPDGRWVASASEDATLRLYQVATSTSRVLQGHTAAVTQVAFAPDGRTLASASDDLTVRLWDVRTLESRSLRGHAGQVRSLAFSPDGQWLASGSADRTTRLWRVTSDEQRVLDDPDRPPARGVFNLAFSPDGGRLAATFDLETIRVWDVVHGQLRVLRGHDGAARPGAWLRGTQRIVFSADGAVLASASHDTTIRLWTLATGDSRVLRGHEGTVTDVAFSPDAKTLASSSTDRSVRLWDLAGGDSRVLRGHEFAVERVAFSPDGQLLGSAAFGMKRDTGQADLSVQLWEVSTGTARPLRGHGNTVTAVQFSPDGRALASGSMDTTVRLWDRPTGQSRVLKRDGSIVFALAYSPDGRWLAASHDGGHSRLWELATGKSRLLERTRPPISFSSDSQTFAGVDVDGARLWDVATGESRVLPGICESVALSPDGPWVATIGSDGVVRLWKDDLPRDPALLRSWLAKATDLTVAAGH